MVKTKFISLIAFCTMLVTSSLAQNFSLLPVTVDGKVGYIDTTGNLVIEPKFDFGNYFHDNGRAMVRNGDKEQVIDSLGNYLCEPFDELGFYPRSNDSESPHWISAKKDGKWGYLDENFEEVIPFIYDEAEQFKDGIAIVKKKKKFGYYDSVGNYFKLGKYEYVRYLGEGLLKVTQSHSSEGVYDLKSKSMLVELGDYNIGEITQGRFTVYDSELMTDKVLDIKGNTLLIPKKGVFIALSLDSDLLIAEDINTDKHGILQLNEEWALKPELKFDDVYAFESCGNTLFATFRIDRERKLPLYGAINENGKVVIEPIYTRLTIGKNHIFFTLDEENTEGIMDCNQTILLSNDRYTNTFFITDEILGIEIGEFGDSDFRSGYMHF